MQRLEKGSHEKNLGKAVFQKETTAAHAKGSDDLGVLKDKNQCGYGYGEGKGKGKEEKARKIGSVKVFSHLYILQLNIKFPSAS